MSLESAIKATIKYAHKHNCDLTIDECKERLLSSTNYELRITNYEFKKKNDNRYFEAKMKLAQDLVANHLFKFRDILMVGVTGSVASKYPKKNDDIDLMIITKSESLWITRFCLKLYLVVKKINHRKYREKHENNKFCFNLWLDEEGLKLPKIKRNTKNAVDMILMIPLVDINNTYKKFLLANSWVKRYVATPYSKKLSDSNYQTPIKIKKKKSLINWLMFWGQYLYMRKKIKREIVDYHWAFFHPNGENGTIL